MILPKKINFTFLFSLTTLMFFALVTYIPADAHDNEHLHDVNLHFIKVSCPSWSVIAGNKDADKLDQTDGHFTEFTNFPNFHPAIPKPITPTEIPSTCSPLPDWSFKIATNGQQTENVSIIGPTNSSGEVIMPALSLTPAQQRALTGRGKDRLLVSEIIKPGYGFGVFRCHTDSRFGDNLDFIKIDGNSTKDAYCIAYNVPLPPIIFNEMPTQVTNSSVTITWLTDHPATSRVIYDTISHPVLSLPPNYGYASSTFEDPALVTNHSVNITGLLPGTTYFFRAVSHGSPETVGQEFSVTTSAATSVLFLRPDSDSPVQEWDCFNSSIGLSPVHFTNVNEEIPDDPSSFCSISAAFLANQGKRNMYTVNNTSAAGLISNVSVIGRARRDNLSSIPINLKLGFKNSASSSAEFDGGVEFPVDNNWTDYETAFGATNPSTSLPWTWTDINNLEIFHKLGSLASSVFDKLVVTQIFLKVTHIP